MRLSSIYSAREREEPRHRRGLVAEPAEEQAPRFGLLWRQSLVQAAALGLVLALLTAIWLFARPLALVFAAIVLAETLAPLAARLERWLPRPSAVVVVYLVILLAFGGLVWLAVPPLVEQARLLVIDGPELVAQARSRLDLWDPEGNGRIVEAVETQVLRFSGALVALPLAVVASLLEIVLVLFMSLYWLLAKPNLRRFAGSVVPEPHRAWFTRTLEAMGQTMGGFVRATVLDASIVGLAVYVGLRLIGVDFPLVLALIAALGELIPVAGPILAAVPAVAIALIESPTQALIVLVFYVALQQFESNVLMPNIMRKQADVPPLLAIFALLAGASVGGILGALIAIPLAGAMRVVVLRLVPRPGEGPPAAGTSDRTSAPVRPG